MGKRSKEPHVGRRRPMIQLGNARKTVGVVSRNTTAEEEAPGVTEKKLENALEAQKSAAANNMDDELAGFLAEINSLETPQEVATTNGKTVADPTNAAALLYDPTTFDPSTQGHLLPAPWEACYDESTGYYYYWNKTTNEVQWYPPTVTVPPPPPPPPPLTESEEEEVPIDSPLPVAEKQENNENIEPETDDVCQEDKESPENELKTEDAEDNEVSVTVKVGTESQDSVPEKEDSPDKDKKNEKESIIEREEENDGISSVDREKEKDKELMNQIKEKIRRKKEEKLMKEKEELSALKQQQQQKEDMLREKLIQKKKEREEKKESPPLVAKSLKREKSPIADKKIVDIKSKSSEEDQDDQDEGENDVKVLNDSKTEEDFSLDMFAEEINNSPKDVLGEKGEGRKSQDHLELPETKVTVKEIETKTEDLETVTESPLENKEVKGSWRIVDSVYDEDDDEEDDEIKDESEIENNSSTDSEGSEKSVGEMEDYANMLLEDGIVEEKRDSKTKKSRSNAPPIPATPIDTPPPPPPDAQPPLPPEDEPPPALPEMSVEEEESRKIEIDRLSTEIFEKLDFLGITTKELRNLTRYLVEIEARHKDWKAGALNTKYFLKCLSELSGKIVQHEEQAAPPGWLCHWSSEFKMYYYYNTVSGESQWEFPEPPQSQEETPIDVTLTEPPPPPPDESELNRASLVSPAHGFSREPVQTSTKIKKKKRAVVEETPQIQDPYRDPYRQAKRMKSDPPEENTFSGNESGTSSPLPNVIAAAPQIMRTREFSPVPSGGNPLLPGDDNIDETQSPIPYKQEKVASINKPKVKKKKKPESGNLLPNKKLKHVSSLVQKWQTVKQQVEEEENAELESDEEDYETASERRIEEWKKEVEVTGEKEYNPNFMEIKSDWRERLLKRKT